MNAEIKTKWVAALRSGKYRPTVGTLRDKSGFCCLGILCDIMQPNGWHKPNLYMHLGERSLPNTDLFLKADIRYDDLWTLSQKNDSGWSFESIAQWIEANL